MIKQPLWPLLKRRLILHIDPILMLALSLLLMTGLIILFSATDGNWGRVMAQAANILVALLFMWLVANTPLHYLMRIVAGGIDRAPARPGHCRADLSQRILCAVPCRVELARNGRDVYSRARQRAGGVVHVAA